MNGEAVVPETGARWWAVGERCEVFDVNPGTFGSSDWWQGYVTEAVAPEGTVGQQIAVRVLDEQGRPMVRTFGSGADPSPWLIYVLTGHPIGARCIRTPSAPGGYRLGDAIEIEQHDGSWAFAAVASVGTAEDGPEFGAMRVEFEDPSRAPGYATGAVLDMDDPSVRARVRRAITTIGGVDVTGNVGIAALLAGLSSWDQRDDGNGRRTLREVADMTVAEAATVMRRVARAIAEQQRPDGRNELPTVTP